MYIIKMLTGFSSLFAALCFIYFSYLLIKKRSIKDIDTLTYLLWGIVCLSLSIYAQSLPPNSLILNKATHFSPYAFIIIGLHILVLILIYIYRVYKKIKK